jgi:hypothetical protein
VSVARLTTLLSEARTPLPDFHAVSDKEWATAMQADTIAHRDLDRFLRLHADGLAALWLAAREYHDAQEAEDYHRETGWGSVLKTDAWSEALKPLVLARVRAYLAMRAALVALDRLGETT